MEILSLPDDVQLGYLTGKPVAQIECDLLEVIGTVQIKEDIRCRSDCTLCARLCNARQRIALMRTCVGGIRCVSV